MFFHVVFHVLYLFVACSCSCLWPHDISPKALPDELWRHSHRRLDIESTPFLGQFGCLCEGWRNLRNPWWDVKISQFSLLQLQGIKHQKKEKTSDHIHDGWEWLIVIDHLIVIAWCFNIFYGCCHRLLLGIQHQSKPLGCPKLSTVDCEATVKQLDDWMQTPCWSLVLKNRFLCSALFSSVEKPDEKPMFFQLCSLFPPGVVKAQLQAQLSQRITPDVSPTLLSAKFLRSFTGWCARIRCQCLRATCAAMWQASWNVCSAERNQCKIDGKIHENFQSFHQIPSTQPFPPFLSFPHNATDATFSFSRRYHIITSTCATHAPHDGLRHQDIGAV